MNIPVPPVVSPIGVLTVLGILLAATPASGADLVLVDQGVRPAPIVIFKDAPPLTRLAADELALYIEKTSGAKPQVIKGDPQPTPQHAIWVGYQPRLKELFPNLDFDFKYPEEILIAANENHLVIAGRDRWDPEHLVVTFQRGTNERTVNGIQQEYGTHNAVYTFLQDYLGVRWLWPGELGEDILKQETIAFQPFAYRYHPQVRARGGLLAYSTLDRLGPGMPEQPTSGYWLRAQRLQLCELTSLGGHAFSTWWDRFHETHPEYFALQPDGTRGGGATPYPDERTVKMCHSNPELAKQWLDDVAAQLEENPNQRVFNASPNDGWYSGHCMCENCRAWDHPDGELRPFVWKGVNQEYVALSDRDVTFANRLARGLKERFPGRELYVYMLAYGHSRPPPVAAVPDDNVIIGNVANFLLRSDMIDRGSVHAGRRERQNFGDWGRVAKLHFWRPNTGSPVGWQLGLPDVPFTRTIEDMKFAADHGMMGIYIDYVREHWSTQAPMYYLMAQLIWNPRQDGQAILKDYYHRAFGPAAAEMEAYWTYLEKIREECYGTEKPGVSDHDFLDFYDKERLDVAQGMLDRAVARAADGPDAYRRRIEFVEAGLTFTRLYTECGRLMRRVENQEDPDGSARAQVIANWEKIRAVQQKYPGAMRWNKIFEGSKGDGPPRSPASGVRWYPDRPLSGKMLRQFNTPGIE